MIYVKNNLNCFFREFKVMNLGDVLEAIASGDHSKVKLEDVKCFVSSMLGETCQIFSSRPLNQSTVTKGWAH